jgi:hypothetical protein
MVDFLKPLWIALPKVLGIWVRYHQILTGAMRLICVSYMQLKMHWDFHEDQLKVFLKIRSGSKYFDPDFLCEDVGIGLK